VANGWVYLPLRALSLYKICIGCSCISSSILTTWVWGKQHLASGSRAFLHGLHLLIALQALILSSRSEDQAATLLTCSDFVTFVSDYENKDQATALISIHPVSCLGA
jgi:hypothetical protein